MSKLSQPMRQVSDRALEHLSKERDDLVTLLASGYTETVAEKLARVQATIELIERMRGG